MAYTPTAWVNGTTPAINATNLNKIETGIDEAHDDIATLNAALVTDLIAGVTPTLADWTVDPTDSADITDGDPATFCTAGNNRRSSTIYFWKYRRDKHRGTDNTSNSNH
jgi:hypothetical protein